MKYLVFILTCFLLLSCNKTEHKQKIDTPFIPIEASLILKVNHFEKATSLLKNNSLLQQNKKNSLYLFFEELNSLQLIQPQNKEFYICFSPLGKNDFGVSIITNTANTQISWQSIQKYFVKNRSYNNKKYKELNFKNQNLYATQIEDNWVITNDYLLMENHIKQNQNNLSFKHPKAIQSLENENFSIIAINSEVKDITKRLFPNLSDNHFFNEKISGWTAGDITINKNLVDFNGIYKPSNELTDISKIFEGVTPSTNQISEITPLNFSLFTSFSYHNYEVLKNNLSKYNHLEVQKNSLHDLLSETSEFGTIELSKSKLFVSKLINDDIVISDYIKSNNSQFEYRGFPIYKLIDELNFEDFLTPLVKNNKANFYTTSGGFILFSETIEGLKEIIPSLKNKSLLSEKKWYQNFSNQLTAQSAALCIANTSHFFQNIATAVEDTYSKNWQSSSFKNYKINGIQFIPEEKFSHLHLISLKTIETISDFKVNENENIILKEELLNHPQFLKNHRNKQYDIIVQEKSNHLTLINNKGEIFWRKDIQEPILGKVRQMDMYKNGRLQLVFTTPSKLHVLDRNGNEVAPFPISFKTKITQPIAVFDYDNNRKYRLLVTQNDILKMYDSKGKEVKGFNFKNKSKGTITHTPKHIRVGKKDFIIVNETNTGVHFLNRQGKERIKLKGDNIETTNEWFWYKSAFSTLNVEDLIAQVNTSGEISNIKPQLKIPQASSTATAKTWVAFAENSLSIKNKTIELEYGSYTSPKIFYINDKVFVSITNIDSKQVYLFDSNAKSIDGFPVYGTGMAIIENADKDSNLELAVKGDKNSILLYEFRY